MKVFVRNADNGTTLIVRDHVQVAYREGARVSVVMMFGHRTDLVCSTDAKAVALLNDILLWLEAVP